MLETKSDFFRKKVIFDWKKKHRNFELEKSAKMMLQQMFKPDPNSSFGLTANPNLQQGRYYRRGLDIKFLIFSWKFEDFVGYRLEKLLDEISLWGMYLNWPIRGCPICLQVPKLSDFFTKFYDIFWVAFRKKLFWLLHNFRYTVVLSPQEPHNLGALLVRNYRTTEVHYR